MTTQISDYLTPDEMRVANVYLARTMLNIFLKKAIKESKIILILKFMYGDLSSQVLSSNAVYI